MNKTNTTGLPAMLEYVTKGPWAMDYGVLEQMIGVVERHFRGEKIAALQIAEISANSQQPHSGLKAEQDDLFVFEPSTRTAVIAVDGVIAKHSRMVNDVSQPRGTSVEVLREQLSAAVQDSRVDSIFLQIESPGGSINGVADLGDAIYRASMEKPIVAFADDSACSAAYWIGSQANLFYATQTALIGSIGVYMMSVVSSAAAEQEGLKFKIYRSGQHKGVGHPGVAITDENDAAAQVIVDDSFGIFLNAILRGRAMHGLTADNLRDLADGRCFVGQVAVANKLVDGIMTLEAALLAPRPQVRTEAVMDTAAKTKKESQIMVDEKATEQEQAPAVDVEAVAKTERERVMALSALLAGDDFADVRTQAIDGQLSIQEAKALAFSTMQSTTAAQITALESSLTEANKKLQVIADAGTDVTAPATQEQDDTGATALDDGQAQTYANAVRKFQYNGDSKAKAYCKAVDMFPQSHQAWKEANASTVGTRK